MFTSQANPGAGGITRPATGSAAMAGDTSLSPWCSSWLKRALDAAVAGGLLLATFPIMLAVAVAVKLGSRGPVLFRQKRVGRNGRIFELVKFRSMRVAAERSGPGITSGNDPRILPLGRVLRRWKLDELPQLFNVLRGDMSLVGPRPDLPEFCATLDQKQSQILELRPGITGAATLQYRHEEQILADRGCDDVKTYYVNHIYRDKVRLDLEYARRASVSGDFLILFRTFGAIFSWSTFSLTARH